MKDTVKTRVLFRSRHINIYSVRYPEGHRVIPHLDMVSEGRLFKLNLVLKKPKAGGRFVCDKNVFNLFGRVYLFRPDLYQHQVTRIEKGHRRILSFAVNAPQLRRSSAGG